MFSTENKNTGKYLAAIMVLVMVFAGSVVLFSEESTAATDDD